MAQDAFASSRDNPDALRRSPYAPGPIRRARERGRLPIPRDRAILSEVGAYSRLQSEQQRAMRELVTGEYWRMIAIRDAPHKEPVVLSGAGAA
jgi:hypothetical protein